MVDVVLVGCGGVGLPLAVALASRGANVVGFDIDRARVRALAEGALEIEDDGLAPALARALADGSLSFARDLAPAAERRAFIIAVPTPVDAQGAFVSEPLFDAFRAVCAVARDGDLVAVRSTAPVGMLRKLAAATAGDRQLLFAACPDRSVAGRAFDEQFRVPNLIGGLTAEAAEAAREVFERLGTVQLVSSPEAAEAAKLFANVWRDAQFALANQFALFCESVGVDFAEVRQAGGEHFPRFAPPRAGPVGGPCLTKDVYLLAEAVDADVSLLLAARTLNNSLAGVVARRICAAIDAGRGRRVAILGLAFKGNPPTLDRRGSFGMDLTALLEGMRPDVELRTWDPAAEPNDLRRAAAVCDADVVVLANDHAALGHPGVLDGCARDAVVFDLCGVLPDDVGVANVAVERFGRGRPSIS